MSDFNISKRLEATAKQDKKRRDAERRAAAVHTSAPTSIKQLQHKPPEEQALDSDWQIVSVGAPQAPVEVRTHHSHQRSRHSASHAPRPAVPTVEPSDTGAVVGRRRHDVRREDPGRVAATVVPPETGYKYSACTGRRKALCVCTPVHYS